MSSPPKERPPRYVDKGLIGSGGMAAIHKELDGVLLRHVARKVLTVSTDHPEMQRRFLEEAQISAQLEHPGVVPIHDLGVSSDGRPSFTMMLVQGNTLMDLLQTPAYDATTEDGLQRCLNVFMKVCDAVAFAHSKHVVHRDLKPENIMVGSFGQVYVMDWGVAQLLTNPMSTEWNEDHVRLNRDPSVGNVEAEGTVAGTLTYMPPEQANGRVHETDFRSDVYTLGGILYEMLTLMPPHMAWSVEELGVVAKAGTVNAPQSVVQAHRVLPPLLCRIAMKALQYRREDRYQSVGAMKDDIERFLRGGNWFGSQTFGPGVLIMEEGQEADAAYIITRGECEAFVMRDGERKSLRKMGPGSVFGEAGIFTNRPRSASVVTLTPVTAVVITRTALEEQIGMDSWTGAFVKTLAERFRELDARHGELSQAHEEQSILAKVMDHMAFHGHPLDDSTLSARLSAVLELVAPIPADRVLRVLGRSRRCTVDEGRDEIRFLKEAPAAS